MNWKMMNGYQKKLKNAKNLINDYKRERQKTINGKL